MAMNTPHLGGQDTVQASTHADGAWRAISGTVWGLRSLRTSIRGLCHRRSLACASDAPCVSPRDRPGGLETPVLT